MYVCTILHCMHTSEIIETVHHCWIFIIGCYRFFTTVVNTYSSNFLSIHHYFLRLISEIGTTGSMDVHVFKTLLQSFTELSKRSNQSCT